MYGQKILNITDLKKIIKVTFSEITQDILFVWTWKGCQIRRRTCWKTFFMWNIKTLSFCVLSKIKIKSLYYLIFQLLVNKLVTCSVETLYIVWLINFKGFTYKYLKEWFQIFGNFQFCKIWISTVLSLKCWLWSEATFNHFYSKRQQ